VNFLRGTFFFLVEPGNMTAVCASPGTGKPGGAVPGDAATDRIAITAAVFAPSAGGDRRTHEIDTEVPP
jgi:hypothetical protein